MAKKNNNSLDELRIAYIGTTSKRRADMDATLEVPIDATFVFIYELSLPHGNEFVEATLTPAQILKCATSSGSLSITTSGKKRLPRGQAALSRLATARA